MMTKIIVLIAMFLIVYALGSGLFFLVRGDTQDRKMVKALTVRIALSLTLFIFLFLAFAMGWLTPHPI